MNDIFDYERFKNLVKSNSKEYLNRYPYPYAIFDGLFDDAFINLLNAEIDREGFKRDSRNIEGEEVKVRSDFDDNEALPQYTRRAFEIINGGKFLNLVSELTGVEGLISDPYYDGGGINIIENGGTLAVHVDGTDQHRMKISRRLNAILFLNDNWEPAWNGYHEQWDFMNKDLSPLDERQVWRCARKILPRKNRMLVFTTNDHSWHGHAGVLKVPEGVKRRSLIAYYYTSSRPESDLMFSSPHRAIFINNSITLKNEAFESTEVVL